MEYNWKVLFNDDMLDDRLCGLIDVTLSPNHKLFCDELVDWKYVKEFNQIYHNNTDFHHDYERTRLLQKQAIPDGVFVVDGYNVQSVYVPGDTICMKVQVASYKNKHYQLDYFNIQMTSTTQMTCHDGSLYESSYNSYRQFICMYEIENINKFWVVTCDGHPAVATSDFSYVNSDGSGPSLIYDPDNFQEIYDGFYDEFNEISRDNYH